MFGNLGGRGYGISRKEATPGCQGPSAQATSPVIKCLPVKTAGFMHVLQVTSMGSRSNSRNSRSKKNENGLSRRGYPPMARELPRSKCQVGTDNFAIMTIHTIIRQLGHRKTVALTL